ncbi:unnamed protein product [Trichobilharzia regenti]|nr:unnamed protein product [Trichobilharzia regenti]
MPTDTCQIIEELTTSGLHKVSEMTTIFNNNLINENYSVEKMNKQYPCRNTENDFTVKTDSEASSLTNQSVDLGKLFNFQSQLQLQNDDHQQQQQYQELISLMSYRNNIAQLANSYEQIIKTFRKVELEAKAYKVSAVIRFPSISAFRLTCVGHFPYGDQVIWYSDLRPVVPAVCSAAVTSVS